MKGVTTTRLSYKADPEKADPRWKDIMSVGVPTDKWDREYEMDANAGMGLSIYGREYRPEKHERPLTPSGLVPMGHGWDFGHGWPATVWVQRTAFNGVRILASMFGQDMQLRLFAPRAIAFEINVLGGPFQNRRDYVDPAGSAEKDDGMQSVAVLRDFGYAPRWRGSKYTERHEYVSQLLKTDQEDGEPMFLIDPRHNVELCQGFRALYRRTKSGDPERNHPVIDLMNALEYYLVNTKTGVARRPPSPPNLALINEVSGYGPWGLATAREGSSGRLIVDAVGGTSRYA